MQRPPSGPPSRIVRTELAAFQGPLPPPEQLAQYEQILPGAAERILGMAEAQAAHRQRLERAALDNDHSEARLGQIFGFPIALAGMAVGAYVALSSTSPGSQIAGGLIGLGPLATLVGVFVYGRKKAQQQK